MRRSASPRPLDGFSPVRHAAMSVVGAPRWTHFYVAKSDAGGGAAPASVAKAGYPEATSQTHGQTSNFGGTVDRRACKGSLQPLPDG